mgnify:CR=1 FL=1
MKKEKIKVSPGIKFLSEMGDLFNVLPNKGHYIFNKKVCGCGATELFLGCDKKCILASPRKNLLYSKYSQHLSDNFHLFRYEGDRDKYFANGSISSSETVTYKDNLRDYVKNGAFTDSPVMSKALEEYKMMGSKKKKRFSFLLPPFNDR